MLVEDQRRGRGAGALRGDPADRRPRDTEKLRKRKPRRLEARAVDDRADTRHTSRQAAHREGVERHQQLIEARHLLPGTKRTGWYVMPRFAWSERTAFRAWGRALSSGTSIRGAITTR